ncbi:hypothetical protein EK904_003658 [Melospiza melodia maxima]|nr:hypothetical protein EK904_003658 [Melospiza melodia maxima]
MQEDASGTEKGSKVSGVGVDFESFPFFIISEPSVECHFTKKISEMEEYTAKCPLLGRGGDEDCRKGHGRRDRVKGMILCRLLEDDEQLCLQCPVPGYLFHPTSSSDWKRHKVLAFIQTKKTHHRPAQTYRAAAGLVSAFQVQQRARGPKCTSSEVRAIPAQVQRREKEAEQCPANHPAEGICRTLHEVELHFPCQPAQSDSLEVLNRLTSGRRKQGGGRGREGDRQGSEL